MKRILQFLTGYIEKTIVESKVWCIEDAFQTDDCFNDVPNEPGIYIMVAKKRDFVYPKKDSPVFYIGTSKHLRNRLKTHLKLYKEAKADFNKHSSWNYCRYNYAVAFDADIFYMRITGRENEKALESKAMEGFYDKYGALPVGNGAFSFRK
jgi:hypothetical protein